MLRFVLLAFLIAAVSAAPFQAELDTYWMNFKKTFNKSYSNQEETARRLIWEGNLAVIIKHNIEADLGKYSYKLGINHLADMTTVEVNHLMKGIRGYKNASKSGSTFVPPYNTLYTEEIDWRREGLVTPVKDQGQCGSCWAFSTTGSLEGQHKKKTGTLVSLSEQNLVDCSGPQGNDGCNGGFMDRAFEYIKENGGIDTEACYPYQAVQGPCRFRGDCIGATVTGFVDIPSGNEEALRQATATVGPISVVIDASHSSFQLYSGGIYDEENCSSTKYDHGVLVVGYGTDNGKDFWLVKNSWGTDWGESGYVRMSRNKNNQCGIATLASYPLV